MSRIDTSIYNNLQPTVKLQTPFELQAGYQQLQHGQNQNRLSQMQFQKAERDLAQENALAGAYKDYYAQPTQDPNMLYKNLAGAGQGAAIPGVMETMNKAAKSGVDLSNAKLTGQKMQGEITQAQRERSAAKIGAHLSDPDLTTEKILADLQSQVQSGELNPEDAQAMAQRLPQDPAQLKPFLYQILQSVMKPKEQVDLRLKDRDFGLKSANEPFKADGTPNTAYQNYSINKATAGAIQNYGSPVAGMQNGKPVFFQPNKGGGAPSVVQGVTPPISATERKAEADLKAASARKQGAITQVANVLKEIDDAEKLVGYSTAGVGGLMKRIPMTDARNLDAKLTTIKANLGFDRLQQMREESPTGGALGQVAVQELTALQATVASLDQLQDPGQLKEALAKIKKHYKAWGEVMKKASGGDNTPPTGNIDAASSYLSGAKDKADFIARARALKAKGWTEEQIAAANGE